MSDDLGDAYEAVLDGARAGAGWAFERLYVHLARPVAAYLRGAGLEDPEGSANEVLLRVFRSLDRFSGDEPRFRSWVFTIAHHLVVDERRRAARRPQLTGDRGDLAGTGPIAPDTADLAVLSLGSERVDRLLDQLATDQRDVVLLRIVADLSIEETAAALGKRPGAVKSLQHRAMQALRKLLEQEAITP